MTSPTASPFDHQPRTRLIFGLNTVERVGELALELGAKRVLLVTDPGIVAAGHASRVIKSLEAQGLAVACFDKAQENPGTRCVAKCVEVAREFGIDTIVGLGGGSSMDTAKGCNFLLTNGGRMQDYRGIGKARLPMLPLIAIPTTGGTGSECQSFALITDEQTHQKMACGDPKAAARIAILDPALTLSQPASVTACSGIDAIAHAIETAVTTKRTTLSLLFSREALRLTLAGLPRVLQNPNDLEARGQMLLGAAWAGTAIENSMLGAAHAAANPLTAHFGIVHGHAVGLMLPHVIRFNAADPSIARAYADATNSSSLAAPNQSEGGPAAPKQSEGGSSSSSFSSSSSSSQPLAQTIEHLLDLAHLPSSLKNLRITPDHIPLLAREAATQWTAQFNPRPLTTADFEGLYTAASNPESGPVGDDVPDSSG